MNYPQRIDLHMHSTVSDGTDTPSELLEKVRESGLELFALTDHDAAKGSDVIIDQLREGDPVFINGAEFSCRDEGGKYHILGYGFDPASTGVAGLIETGHSIRMKKVRARIERLKEEFSFDFSDEDKNTLFASDNPGKPHIANLMVKYGFAETKESAMKDYLNRIRLKSEYIRPETAIDGILKSGGIPVLAHPFYGSGDELILGEEMEERLSRLCGMGLLGVEAFYSGFTPKLTRGMISLAERFGLYVTAGSDYHGKNKSMISIGDIGALDDVAQVEGFKRFYGDVRKWQK